MAFAIGKPMPVPSHAVTLVFAAIKFFENQDCSGSSIPLPRSATLVTTKSPLASAVIVMGWSARRILIGILDQMDQNFADAARSTRTRGSPAGISTRTSRSPSERSALVQRGRHHILDRCGFNLQLDFAGIEPRHFAGFADEPVQSVAFLVDDGQQFVSLRDQSMSDSRANWSRRL